MNKGEPGGSRPDPQAHLANGSSRRKTGTRAPFGSEASLSEIESELGGVETNVDTGKEALTSLLHTADGAEKHRAVAEESLEELGEADEELLLAMQDLEARLLELEDE